MDALFEPMDTTPKAEEKQTHVLKDTLYKSSDPDADSSPITVRALDGSLPTQESSNGTCSTVKINTSEPPTSDASGKGSSVGKLVSKASSTGKARTLPTWLSELSSGNKPPLKKRKTPTKTG